MVILITILLKQKWYSFGIFKNVHLGWHKDLINFKVFFQFYFPLIYFFKSLDMAQVLVEVNGYFWPLFSEKH